MLSSPRQSRRIRRQRVFGGSRRQKRAARELPSPAPRRWKAHARGGRSRSPCACKPRSWSGYRTSQTPLAQPLETAIRCFRRAAAAPLSSDLLPSATPSFRFLARPATISAAAAFSSATSRKGLGIPSSTLRSAIALASASPPFRASPPTRLRPASSGVTSKVRILPFSSAATKVGPVRVISSRPSEPCTTQTDSAPRFFSTCASGCTHCRENTPTICRLTPAGLDSGPSKLKIVRVASSTRVGPTFFQAGWCDGANMKPMPASVTQGPTCSGVMSILTPSEDSTSAAPERDESARLPCLATGTPAPATMNEAQVETLTEPEPSPPVPTTSIASGGASTRSILERVAETAPVISSTVSPRTRSAISKPPICEGVASPDIMLSKAEAASSRDSVAPVATFPMIAFRSSIACFRECSVIRARHLCEGRLVDGGADVAFELGDILPDLFIGQSALEGFLQFLHVIRGKVDRRHADIGDAEYDPLAVAGTGGLSDAILGGAKRRRNRAGRHAGRRGVTPESAGGFHLRPDACRLVSEVAALFELLHHFGGLGPQLARDLVVAPSGLDLVLDLVEAAFARWRDAENVVPDIAAVERNRIVVDADVAVEGLRDDIETARNVVAQLTARGAAGAIDGVDGDGGEPEFLGGFDHPGAAAALVFHLVAQFGCLGARALGGNFLLQVRGDGFIGRLDARLDLADLDQRYAELALHRLADFAGRQRKRRVGNRGIDHG